MSAHHPHLSRGLGVITVLPSLWFAPLIWAVFAINFPQSRLYFSYFLSFSPIVHLLVPLLISSSPLSAELVQSCLLDSKPDLVFPLLRTFYCSLRSCSHSTQSPLCSPLGPTLSDLVCPAPCLCPTPAGLWSVDSRPLCSIWNDPHIQLCIHPQKPAPEFCRDSPSSARPLPDTRSDYWDRCGEPSAHRYLVNIDQNGLARAATQIRRAVSRRGRKPEVA